MLAALLVGANGFMLVSPPARTAVGVTRVDTPPAMNMIDDWMKGNDILARNFRKMMAQPPSAEDIAELCRDEESSGCTLDMLDELAKTKEIKAQPMKYRWSAEID